MQFPVVIALERCEFTAWARAPQSGTCRTGQQVRGVVFRVHTAGSRHGTYRGVSAWHDDDDGATAKVFLSNFTCLKREQRGRSFSLFRTATLLIFAAAAAGRRRWLCDAVVVIIILNALVERSVALHGM